LNFAINPLLDANPRTAVAAGIGFMLASVTLYSCLDALAKWTVAIYPAAEFMVVRSITAIAVLLPFLARNDFAAFRNVPKPRLQLLRVVLATGEAVLFFTAVYYLPLAETITVYLSAPIIVVALSAVFLGEKVGWRRWLAVLAGFVGVVIAMRPSAASVSFGSMIALAGAFCSALLMIMVRRLRGTSQSFMAFTQICGTGLFGLVVAPFLWVPLPWTHLLIFLAAGLASVTGLVCANRALAMAPASIVAPFKFTAILFAATFGYVIFGNVPPLTTIVGAAIIVSAGLYIFMRERSLARAEAMTPQVS
jgi:drug/metabolite transporter (DMT)-like permease